MDAAAAGEMLAYCKSLWPDWDLNEAQASLWVVEFTKLHEVDFTRRAIEKYYSTERQYKIPNLAKIRSHYFVMLERESRAPSISDGTPGYTGYFLLCEDWPSGNNWFVPVFIMNADKGDWLQIIERERKAHEETYGGTWKVFNLTEMPEQNAMISMAMWRLKAWKKSA